MSKKTQKQATASEKSGPSFRHTIDRETERNLNESGIYELIVPELFF